MKEHARDRALARLEQPRMLRCPLGPGFLVLDDHQPGPTAGSASSIFDVAGYTLVIDGLYTDPRRAAFGRHLYVGGGELRAPREAARPSP